MSVDDVPSLRVLVTGPGRAGKSTFINALCAGSKANDITRSSTYIHGHSTNVCLARIEGRDVFLELVEVGDTTAYKDAAFLTLPLQPLDAIIVVVDASTPPEYTYACASASLSEIAHRMVVQQLRGDDTKVMESSPKAQFDSIPLADGPPLAPSDIIKRVKDKLDKIPILVVLNKVDVSYNSFALGWMYKLFGLQMFRGTTVSLDAWEETVKARKTTRVGVEITVGKIDSHRGSRTRFFGCFAPETVHHSVAATFCTAEAAQGKLSSVDEFLLMVNAKKSA